MKITQVAVIGRNYTSLLGIARGAGRAGYPVTLIKTVNKVPSRFSPRRITVEGASKYVKKELFARRNQEQALKQMLVQHFSQEETLLIPTDDNAALMVETIRTQLPDTFHTPLLSEADLTMTDLMDKNIQKQFAMQAGLATARGLVIEIAQGNYQLPDGIPYPCFLKPDISVYMQKTDMARCNTEEELISALNRLTHYGNCRVLVEEFVKFQHEYAVLGCAHKGTVIIPGMIEMLTGGHGTHEGVTLRGRVFPLNEREELREKLSRFVAMTGFDGIFDIDLYEKDGVCYFNEFNVRCGASGYAITQGGANLPELYLELCHKQAVTVPATITHVQDFVNEKVAFEDYMEGYLSAALYRTYLKQSDFRFIYSPDDPNPSRLFFYEKLKQHLKKQISRK